MKPTLPQLYYLVGIFLWLGVLQVGMLGSLSSASFLACNGAGPWPVSHLSLLGNGILTLFITIGLGGWGWRAVAQERNNKSLPWGIISAWALLVGSGLSHAVERLVSGCVLDYWHFQAAGVEFYFNLGDVALTGAVCYLGLSFLTSKQSAH